MLLTLDQIGADIMLNHLFMIEEIDHDPQGKEIIALALVSGGGAMKLVGFDKKEDRTAFRNHLRLKMREAFTPRSIVGAAAVPAKIVPGR